MSINLDTAMSLLKDYRYNYAKGLFRAAVRKIVGRDKYTLKKYNGNPILSLQSANDLIRESIESDKPFMAGRFGDGELRSIVCYLNRCVGMSKTYPDYIRTAITRNAGVFPGTDDTIDKFAELMIKSCHSTDILAVWFNFMEDYIYNKFGPTKQTCVYLKSLEPFWFDRPWTEALSGKRVLVIHPFEETIRSQYDKKTHLFSNPNILPEFELLTLKAVQTIGGNSERFSNWFEAFDWMYSQAMGMDFDIALIGCGAYGFPLAAKIKSSGKMAIHLGGVTQMLFGIKGGRWDNRPDYAALYNEYWCRPSEKERPNIALQIENACYW